MTNEKKTEAENSKTSKKEYTEKPPNIDHWFWGEVPGDIYTDLKMAHIYLIHSPSLYTSESLGFEQYRNPPVLHHWMGWQSAMALKHKKAYDISVWVSKPWHHFIKAYKLKKKNGCDINCKLKVASELCSIGSFLDS